MSCVMDVCTVTVCELWCVMCDGCVYCDCASCGVLCVMDVCTVTVCELWCVMYDGCMYCDCVRAVVCHV